MLLIIISQLLPGHVDIVVKLLLQTITLDPTCYDPSTDNKTLQIFFL